MTTRLRLRRSDGRVYLERWGFECRFGGVFVHRMSAPDPGRDLHDHPWVFGSFVLRGGYVETRSDIRLRNWRGGVRRQWSWRTMRLDECHRITRLRRTPTWTLVIHGRPHRMWGFYTERGWMDAEEYGRSGRRELEPELGSYV